MYLTNEQHAVNDFTWRHIWRVRELLQECVKILLDRGYEHDHTADLLDE